MITRLMLILSICSCTTGPIARIEYNFNEMENGCRCVPKEMCLDNDTTINGEGVLDIRYYDVTCKNYFDVCCETVIAEDRPQLSKDDFKGCGYRTLIGRGARITGPSKNAHFGEFPWTVIILYRELDGGDGKYLYKCGGSLINRQIVLTAAHCVNGANDADGKWIIRAGEWNTRRVDEPLPHQDRIVKEIVIHPQYHAGALKNDVALMFLVEPFQLADNVGIICLPSSAATKLDNVRRCTASGWGRDAFKKGRHSSTLKKVELPIVAREECLKLLRNTRLGQFYHLHRSFICAGGENNKDTCKGDGGSPLICPVQGYKGRYQQMGIVSWGIGCGESNTPGVYVNVALYVEWIDKEVAIRKFDKDTYNITKQW